MTNIIVNHSIASAGKAANIVSDSIWPFGYVLKYICETQREGPTLRKEMKSQREKKNTHLALHLLCVPKVPTVTGSRRVGTAISATAIVFEL